MCVSEILNFICVKHMLLIVIYDYVSVFKNKYYVWKEIPLKWEYIFFSLNSHLKSEVHQNLEENCKINICVIFLLPFFFLYSNILRHKWNKGRYFLNKNTFFLTQIFKDGSPPELGSKPQYLLSLSYLPSFFFVLLYWFNQVALGHNLMKISVTT